MSFQVINQAEPLNEKYCGPCPHVMAGPVQDACCLFGVRLRYEPTSGGRYEYERADKCVAAEKAQKAP